MRIPLQTNLLPNDHPPSDTRARTFPFLRRARRVLRTAIIVLAVAFLVLSWTTRSSNPNVFLAIRDSTAVRSVLTLLRNPNLELIGQREDRVNILLLGIGGEGHEGPLLTDTIILASIRPSTRSAAFISIPRDLAIPLPDGTIQKVNAINAFAEARQHGSGGHAIRVALEDVLGVPIPYHLRVDFAGFSGLIDELGGIALDVERLLDDPSYPIPGREDAHPYESRFEHLVIRPGIQHFDGATALKYVRSRRALGLEGSDFARARRQQRVLLAVRDRALARDVLTNPRRALALLDAWRQHVDTNLTPPEFYALSRLAPDITGSAIAHVVFTDAPGGELVARSVNGTYVLEPRDGSFDRIQSAVASALDTSATAPAPAAPQLSVEIWNGTTVTGLAARTAELIANEQLTITAIRNAPVRNVRRSVIYHRSSVPPAIVARLQRILDADVSTVFPAFDTVVQPTADFLIIVGASSVARTHTETPNL